MRTLEILPVVKQDLQEIWSYIATDDVDAADRVAARIDQEINRLHAVPSRGHRRVDLTRLDY